MKMNFKLVAIWVLIFELLIGPVKDYVETLDFKGSFFHYFDSVWSFALYSSFILVILFYSFGIYFLLHKNYPKRKFLFIIVGIFAIMLMGMGLRYFIEQILFLWIFDTTNYQGEFSAKYYILDNFYYAIVNMFVGAVAYFIQYSNYNELKSRTKYNDKNSELSFLRSQINPHFIFNSLNNLYSLVHSKSDKALPTVSKLSSMLRYSLYEQKEQIEIEKEIDYINDFIELEQLRHSKALQLEMNIDSSLTNEKIAPYLLIPFVENAFKHGVLTSESKPIKIDLSRKANTLVFKVENHISEFEKDNKGGIGLSNLEKRLDLLYPEKHQISFERKEDVYHATLSINLDK